MKKNLLDDVIFSVYCGVICLVVQALATLIISNDVSIEKLKERRSKKKKKTYVTPKIND